MTKRYVLVGCVLLSLGCAGDFIDGVGFDEVSSTGVESYDPPEIDDSVQALRPEPPELQFPANLAPQQWSVVPSLGSTGEPGHRKVSVAGSVQIPPGFQLRNYSGLTAGGVASLQQTRQILAGQTWVTNSKMAVGATCHSVMFWFRERDAVFLLAHPLGDALTFKIPSADESDGGVQSLVNTALPQIAGSPAVGQTLTATAGSWSLPTSQIAFQWQRDGADILGATGQSYVVSAADAFQKMRVVVTAKSGALVASAISTEVLVGGSGTVWTVANTAELVDAIKKSAGGDTILMQPGVYSKLTVSDVAKSAAVTVRAATPGNPPRFTSNPAMSLRRLTNFIFEGFKCELLDSKEVNNGVARATVGSKCIEFFALTNVTFRNNWFDFFGQGIVTASGGLADVAGQASKNVVIENNRFTRRSMDAIRIFKPVNGLTIRRNSFENDLIDAARATESARHPDIIQFATSASSAGSSNVLIEQNKMVLYDGYSHGMFLFSERVVKEGLTIAEAYFDSVTVRGNDIVAPHRNAIAFGGAKNVVVSGNRIRSSPPNTYASVPIVNFYSGCNGSVSNNTAPGPANAQNPGALAKVVQAGNVWNSETASPQGWVELSGLVGPKL